MRFKFFARVAVVATCAVIALLAIATQLPQLAVAVPGPYAGARCYGPSLPLLSNLPLGETSAATEIIDTRVIHDPTGARVAGWYYLNRRGDAFIQAVAGEQEFIAASLSAGKAQTAAASILGNKPLSFIPIGRKESKAFEESSVSRHVMQNCFSHPLGRR